MASLLLHDMLSESGGFSATDFKGNVLYLDSTDSSTLTGTLDWADKSGNANDASEATNPPTTGTTTSNLRNLVDYDGVNDVMVISADATIDNLFAGGGTVICAILPDSDGENDFGRIVDKSSAAGYRLFVGDESAGFCSLSLIHDFSGTTAWWTTATRSVKIGEANTVSITYDNDSDSNVPIILVNGAAQSLTTIASPNGTAVDDSSSDLRIGNNSGGTRTFDGGIGSLMLYNRILTDGEISTASINLANLFGVYTSEATWPIQYPSKWQTAIGVGELSKDTVEAQDYNVNILLGSSIMKGFNSQSSIANALTYLKSTVSGVIMWNYTGSSTLGALETIEAGVNNKADNSLYFGPEMNFAHLVAGLNGEDQYVIKSAVSGGHMSNDSQPEVSYHPTFGDYYGFSRARIDGATDAIAALGVIPKIRYNILLGGNDRTLARYLDVEENYNLLLDSLEADDLTIGLTNSGNANTPIVMTGLVNYASPNGREATVEAAIDAVVAARSNVTKVSILGAEIGTDGIHPTYNGSTEIGSIFAQQLVASDVMNDTSSVREQLLDANDSGSLTDDGGGLISAWDGGDTILTAATTQRPTLTANILNGATMPVVRFNGTSNFMEGGQAAELLFSGQVDAFTVVAWVNNVTQGTVIGKAQSTANGRQWQVYFASGHLSANVGGAQFDFFDLTHTTDPMMIAFSVNTIANTVRAYIDGVASPTVTFDPGSATDTADVLLAGRRGTDSNTGSGFLFDGDIAENQVYSGELTSQMISDLYDVGTAKWGI